MDLSFRFAPALLSVALTIPLSGCFAEASDESVGIASQAEHCDDEDLSCPDVVPGALTPAADQTLSHAYLGVGVQIYTCTASGGGAAWVFTAPEANLYDEHGHLAGTHFAGPTWEANDGSTVVGVKVASAASPDPTAIPWLLLTAASHAGQGRFTDITTVQRLDTVGGVAPASGCDTTTIGSVARVPYSAHYFLYKTKSHGHVQQCGAADEGHD